MLSESPIFQNIGILMAESFKVWVYNMQLLAYY